MQIFPENRQDQLTPTPNSGKSSNGKSGRDPHQIIVQRPPTKNIFRWDGFLTLLQQMSRRANKSSKKLHSNEIPLQNQCKLEFSNFPFYHQKIP